MLDVVQGQQQLVRVSIGLTAELATVVGQDGLHFHAQGAVERQHSVVDQIGGCDRHFRSVDLGKGQRAEGVDYDLNVDLAHALELAPVEGVLVHFPNLGPGLDSYTKCDTFGIQKGKLPE